MTNNKRRFTNVESVLMLTILVVGIVLIYVGYIQRDGWLGLLWGTLYIVSLVVVLVGLTSLLRWARRRDVRAKIQNEEEARGEEARGEEHMSAVTAELTPEERNAIRAARVHFSKPEDRAQDGA